MTGCMDFDVLVESSDLFVVNSDGSGTPERILRHIGNELDWICLGACRLG